MNEEICQEMEELLRFRVSMRIDEWIGGGGWGWGGMGGRLNRKRGNS